MLHTFTLSCAAPCSCSASFSHLSRAEDGQHHPLQPEAPPLAPHQAEPLSTCHPDSLCLSSCCLLWVTGGGCCAQTIHSTHPRLLPIIPHSNAQGLCGCAIERRDCTTGTAKHGARRHQAGLDSPSTRSRGNTHRIWSSAWLAGTARQIQTCRGANGGVEVGGLQTCRRPRLQQGNRAV